MLISDELVTDWLMPVTSSLGNVWLLTNPPYITFFLLIRLLLIRLLPVAPLHHLILFSPRTASRDLTSYRADVPPASRIAGVIEEKGRR
jgi:uncharacterized membrane protein